MLRFLITVFLCITLLGLGGFILTPKPIILLPGVYSSAGESSVFYDKKGELLRVMLANDQRYRVNIAPEDLPQALIDWTLLYEDKHFFEHIGVDLQSLIRAFWETYVIKDRRVGGSTISMQVARLSQGISSRYILGKIWQIYWALCIEYHYSKEEILAAYFNMAPYGGNIEGIVAASLIYFHKPVEKLSHAELMSLVVIPQNPVKRNPSSDRGLLKINKARLRLFNLYVDSAMASKEDENLLSQELSLPLRFYNRRQIPFLIPHASRYITYQNPFLSGEVITTIDKSIHTKAKRRLTEYIQASQKLGIDNAASLIIDHQTMEVLSWNGSADFFNDEIQGQVDGVISKRSPGSALKPFVYGLAIDQGVIHPQTLVKDLPKQYAAYSPENFDARFLGPISAGESLRLSRNVPAVWLQSQLQTPDFHQFLMKAQIKGLKDQSHYGLALSLGAGEVTMLELAQLYGILANKGEFRSIQLLSTNNELNEIKELKSSMKRPVLLTPEASVLTLHMLSSNPHPNKNLLLNHKTGTPLMIPWKTGTSYAFRDAWAVAIAGPYAVLVWVGRFDGSSNPNVIGRKTAGNLLFSILRDLYTENPWQPWETKNQAQALNLKKVTLCSITGELPSPYCPETEESWFIPGVSPIKRMNIFRALPIDNITGERQCWYDPKRSRLEVFEFWPSDIQKQFRLAGLNRRLPPPLNQDCHFHDKVLHARAPVIESPLATLTYTVRINSPSESPVPFKAIVDGDVEYVDWFLNDRYLGRKPHQDTYFWDAKPGEYWVRVVDDKGLTAQKKIKVMSIQ